MKTLLSNFSLSSSLTRIDVYKSLMIFFVWCFFVHQAKAMPTVEGPIAGTPPLPLASYPLENVGYHVSEYFISGTATDYRSASKPSSSGVWPVSPVGTAPYKSRIVVVAPTDPAKFSGTVLVEWMNVSSGSDVPVDWLFAHNEIMRRGHVYVGVSAQLVGVRRLLSKTPERYPGLSHPGDSFAYDIFSQAGNAVRNNASAILPGFAPSKTLIAAGESQSAFYMMTYVNAIAPLAKVFDGYFIHSGADTGAPLSLAGLPPAKMHIRSDLDVPVLSFLTETDVLGMAMAYNASLQPDSGNFRLWTVTGTAHADAYEAKWAIDDDGSLITDRLVFAGMMSPPSSTSGTDLGVDVNLSCPAPLNAGQQYYVVQSALNKLVEWAQTGIAPPSMPRFEYDTSGTSPKFVFDEQGIVKGGVRTPAVDAPVAVLSGLPAPNATGIFGALCMAFGHTRPFKPTEFNALYPTYDDFVNKWLQAVDASLSMGALLPEDAARLKSLVQ